MSDANNPLTPIVNNNSRTKQMRRVALADSTNTTASRSATVLNKPTTEGNQSNISNQSLQNQQNFTSTPLPRRAPAAASESRILRKFNGSFGEMSTPTARPSAIVSVLTVDRVRAPLMHSHSHSIPLLPSPAARSGAARQYSQEALLMLKDSPLIRVGEESEVPVGPWSPGRVNRPARVPIAANKQQSDSVKNLSALFEASTIQDQEEEEEEEHHQKQESIKEDQDPMAEQPSDVTDDNNDEQSALLRRQRQIDITKQSTVYLAYVGRRPRDQRLPSDPRTPRVTQRCSKRAWLGQLAKWRRDLHALANDQPLSPLKPLSPEAANSREFTPTRS
jgi:hypothetical protein